MEFCIRRASGKVFNFQGDVESSDKRPCERSFKKGKHGFYINISSIEELMELAVEVECELIINASVNTPAITIYDNYVE